jgi:hypothetical protein
MIVAVLINDDLASYEGIGPAGYFIIALRESIGDFDTNDSYSNNSFSYINNNNIFAFTSLLLHT